MKINKSDLEMMLKVIDSLMFIIEREQDPKFYDETIELENKLNKILNN
jgi:hypothetical protein